MTAEERAQRQFLERALQWRYELSRLDAEVTGEIVKLLKSAQKDILASMATKRTDWRKSDAWTKQRLADLNVWLDEVLTGAKIGVKNYIEAATVQAAQSSLTAWYGVLSLGGASDAIATVGFTVEQLKAWTADSVLASGTLGNWVDNAFDAGVRNTLFQSITSSGVAGEGVADAVARLQADALVKGISITEREAITLTRTYMQTANVGAMKEVYAANSELFSGYEWCATLDNRTCRICAFLDGKVYKTMDDVPIMPRHMRCRCVIVPKMKSFKDLGIPLDELGEVERAWNIREGNANIDAGSQAKITKHGTTTADFSSWWYTLNAREQAQSVGTVRAKLLRDGELTWDKMADKNGNFYPLSKLGYSQDGAKL